MLYCDMDEQPIISEKWFHFSSTESMIVRIFDFDDLKSMIAKLLVKLIMLCKWCPNQKQLLHWDFPCHWHNLGKSNEQQVNWTELLDLKHVYWVIALNMTSV